MKKILLIASSLLFGLSVNAQSSIEVRNNDLGGVILNNDILTDNVAAAGTSTVHVSIKNISSTTKTYGLYRVDVVINPASTPGVTYGAQPYFCFGGQCFSTTTYTAPAANYVTLTPGQTDAVTPLYLDEDGNVAGYSEVRYTFYDVNNTSDKQTFTIKYNSTLAGLKDNGNLFASVSDVYPNPSVNKAQVIVNSKTNSSDATVTITNALGSVISTNNVELSIGKNNIQLNSEGLSSGIYFATITLGNTRVVRKFTINK